MQRLYVFHALLLAVAFANNCINNPLPDATYAPGYCGFYHFVNFGKAASGLQRPRGIDTAPNGDLITVDTGNGNIWAVFEDANGNAQGTILGNQQGLNHAVRYYQNYIYASSDTTVYRWNYNGRNALSNVQLVMVNMPAGGAHNTRTLEFQGTNVYVNIGSGSNIDTDFSRAKIIYFSLTSALPVDYNSATYSVIAYGTRNSAGLRFDQSGVLWSAENALEIAGGPNYANNPADMIRRFTPDVQGKFFGYPYCYTEGWVPGQTTPARTPGYGPGTQWATNPDSQYTDAWCQDPSNVVKPVFPVRAHEAPLDINFYYGDAFPGLKGRPLTANHGAANRSISIYAINADGSANSDVNSLKRLVYGPYAWQITPVAMTVAPCKAYGQCIFFTDDANGNNNPGIHAIAYTASASSCSNPSACSTGSCCRVAGSTDTCYVSGSYSCITDSTNSNYYVCPTGQSSCNGQCFDPSASNCVNGQVQNTAQIRANCQTMFSQLSCTTSSEDPTQVDANAVASARSWLCSNYPGFCTDINNGGKYSQCNSVEQLSQAMSQYYNANGPAASACSFGGLGQVKNTQNSGTPSTTTATPATPSTGNSGTPSTTTATPATPSTGNSGTPATSSSTTCQNMFSQQQCRTASEDPSQVDANGVNLARSWLCSTYPQYCTDIVAGGQYSSCNSVEQLSQAMTRYYLAYGPTEGANACNFGGVGRIYAVSGGASTTTTGNSATPSTTSSTTPTGNVCQNMFSGLVCRTSSENPSQVDAQAATNARNWLCSNYPQYCSDIAAGGKYSSCNTVEQLSNAMNNYYLAVSPSQGASACNFGGVAQLYTNSGSSNSGSSTTTSCTSMFSTLKCRTSSENPAQVDAQSVTNAQNWLCANYGQFCVDILSGGKYYSCNSVEKISYAMNLYYAQFGPAQGANACNFGGVGQLYA